VDLIGLSQKTFERKISKVYSKKTQHYTQTFNYNRNQPDIDPLPEPDNHESEEKEPENTAQSEEECITDTDCQMKIFRESRRFCPVILHFWYLVPFNFFN
jgi:hypothetical protein